MYTTVRFASSLAIALALSGTSMAQPAPADPGAPPPPRVHNQGGIEYLNGGAGEEARRQIAAEGADFALRIVFSVAGGAYAVADHVDIAKAGGKVLGVDEAGPLLVVKVPPGDYTVEVAAAGKLERRPIRVGSQPVTLNWRLPGDAKP